MKLIRKVVFTGGPCAGKSTVIKYLQEELPKIGWSVLVVHETATELITGGVAPWTCSSNTEYHGYQLGLQCYKEYLVESAAKHMEDAKILILIDRGCLDARAYTTEEEFKDACSFAYIDDAEEYARTYYNAVFHLVTLANEYPNLYTTADNDARHESVEEAIELDDKLWEAWSKHPNHYRIFASKNLETKSNIVFNLIQEFLI